MKSTFALALFVSALACTGELGPTPAPTPAPAPSPVAAPVAAAIPLYEADRLYSADELRRMTLRELSLRRNTIYALAGNPFVKQWLHDYFAGQPWYTPAAAADLSKLSDTDRKNADQIGKVEATLSAEELRGRLTPLLAARDAGTASPEDRIEIKLLSESLGDANDDPAAAGAPGARDPLSHPRMLDKELRPAQLADLSRRDLRLLRNTVFARRGRAFQSELLQSYFAQKAWYEPDPKYSDDRLTEVDRANIATITTEENARGGPIGDKTGDGGGDGEGAPFAGA